MTANSKTAWRNRSRASLGLEVLEDRTVPAYVGSSFAFENLNLQLNGAGVVSILDGADDQATSIDLGANTFNFYGTTYTGANQLFATSNGILTFTAGSSIYTNTPLDSSSINAPTIAALWDDWVTTNDANDLILYKFQGNRLIVEWSDNYHYLFDSLAGGNPVTFQAILELNTGSTPGKITFNYVDLLVGSPNYDNGASATVGIKNTGTNNTGNNAITLSYNTATYAGGQAVQFTSVAPTAKAGGPYSVNEGSTVQLNSGASTAAGGTAIATYEWDLDYDGVTFTVDSTLGNPIFSAASIAGPAARTVALRVTDETGSVSTIDTATVNIIDVPPSIAIAGAPNVLEGSPYSLTLGTISDPGRNVSSIIVHWGDGTSDTYTVNGVKLHTYLDGAANYSVTVDLIDEDGPHTNSANPRSVAVLNVPPTIAVTGSSVVAGTPSTLTLGATTDPGADTITAYLVHWGDGSTDTFTTGGPKIHTYARPGSYVVTVDLTDEDGTFLNRGNATTLVVTPVPVYVPPPPLAVAGVGSDVVVYNQDGTIRFALKPYLGYTGTISVARGDITGDGIDDIVTGTAAGAAGGHVKVFNGATGAEIASFYAYAGFAGGISVALGDVLGSGHAQVITGTGAGGGPHVKVFELGAAGASEVRSFFAYDPTFLGGISVAAGRLDARGHDLLVTGAGPGGGSHVKVFDVATNFRAELRSFMAYDFGFQGGVNVAAGDGHIATGTGAGGGSHVELFRFADGAKVQSFLAYPNYGAVPGYDGAVRVALNERSGTPTIETGAGPGAPPSFQIFRRSDLTLLSGFTIGSLAYVGGINVG